MNSNLVYRVPFYSSWVGLFVFVFILIFQPGKATFYAIRPSDVWLLLCLFLQIINGYNIIIPFRNRFLIRNYGLFMGVLAIIATLIQASYANINLSISCVFYFYFFLRFLLIFKFVENVLSNFTRDGAQKFWRGYTLIGILVMILSYLEFNDIKAFKLLMMNLYYALPEDTIEEYITKAGRLAGVLGNPNNTSMLLVTTLIYPVLRIGIEGLSLIKRILYSVYILAAVYILLVMTGSRSSIFILLVLFSIILIASSRRFTEMSIYVMLVLLLATTGFLLFQRFESNIVLQDRVKELAQGGDFQISVKGIGKWTGRDDLWQDRLRTFQNKGNQLALLLGLGYTKAYEDYADNGLLSAFVNNGLTGLILKLYLFYVFIKFGFLKAIRYYFHFEIDYFNLAFVLSALAILLLELTIDAFDDYKLGQLFYLFLSFTMIINGKIFLTNSK